MNREANIFYNIVKNEISLTEVFCNLLSYKTFRDLFLNIIKEKNKDFNIKNIKFENFQTEKIIDKYGRIDLYLYSDEEYLFEIKINKETRLTENQPMGYLKYLKNNRNLFFILPKGYKHLNQIYEKWEVESDSKDDIKTHNIIFWEDVLDKIKEEGLNELNIFINDFCKIMDYKWFFYKKIKFTEIEIKVLFSKKEQEKLKMLFDTNIPKVIKKLFDIVDETYSKFNIDKSEDRQTSDFYGYKIKDNHNINIWFGVDFEIWEKFNFPLIIEVTNFTEKQSKKLNNLVFFIDKDKDERYFIGLDKQNYIDNENIIKNFEKEIYSVIEKINNIKIDNE